MVPLSIMGVWKNDQKSIVDECAVHVTLFVQALSLELPGERREATLAITWVIHAFLFYTFNIILCMIC